MELRIERCRALTGHIQWLCREQEGGLQVQEDMEGRQHRARPNPPAWHCFAGNCSASRFVAGG